MRAELKSLSISGELADPEYFGVHAQVFIGGVGSQRADSFDVVICSPRWLVDNFTAPMLVRWSGESDNLLRGSQLVLMQRWDEAEFAASCQALCAEHEAADWGTLASRIGRELPWEFEFTYDDFIDANAATRPPFPPRSVV